MNIIIETPRLYLREFTNKDADDFFDMNNDPEVIKYTGDAPFVSAEAAKEFIDHYDHYKVYGFGRWALCDKTSHSFLGFCGLKYHPNQNLVEVGYRLKRKYWGNGYATESTAACLDYGFKKLNLKAIYAHADPENKASANVLTRCGMEYLFDINHDNALAEWRFWINSKGKAMANSWLKPVNNSHKPSKSSIYGAMPALLQNRSMKSWAIKLLVILLKFPKLALTLLCIRKPKTITVNVTKIPIHINSHYLLYIL